MTSDRNGQSDTGLQQCRDCGSEIRYGLIQTTQFTDEAAPLAAKLGQEDKERVRVVPGFACDCTRQTGLINSVSSSNGRIWEDADDWPEQWGGLDA